jgi:hypothetical protein
MTMLRLRPLRMHAFVLRPLRCFLNDWDAAVEDCLASIDLSPDYVKAYARLGSVLCLDGITCNVCANLIKPGTEP